MNSQVQVSHERSGAWAVDHAVRVLTTGCFESRRATSEVGAVILEPASVVLRLTTPDVTALPGWTAEQSGRAWRAPLQWLSTAPVNDRLPDPFPLLVSLGATGDGRVLLNLARADGMISLEGDDALAYGMARSWSRRLTSAPWGSATRVVRVGFEPDPDFSGWDVSRLAEAAPVLDAPDGGVLLFAGRPQGRDLYQVDRLLAEPVRRWSVVAVGAENAAWRFTLRLDGTVDTGLFAEPVHLRA
ncbi:hypothetical protein AB0M02_18235 [Actinoplanes sp. NPDC051861]|uniref:hypothetical protein n=1 Tax=Actinoplanes sp. NPDC051861 TaxID=3155170 RepID=UPI0034233E76